MSSNWFSRYLLPGLVLKAAIIGGGYLSGRELEQYFGTCGLLGGLFGMAVALSVWSLVYALALEFARLHRCYDYRAFMGRLLGPGWVVFEATYLLMILTAISVFVSVAGNIASAIFGEPLPTCEILFMGLVALLLCFGTALVEKFLSLWSFVLYSAFGMLVVLSFSRFGDRITDQFRGASITDLGAAFVHGLQYAGYNISAVAAVLFCARHLPDRRSATLAGVLGGLLAMIPGMLFFVALSAFNPAIRSQAVPVDYLLTRLSVPLFRLAFLAVMAATLLGTCCALIHAVNERVSGAFRSGGRRLLPWGRAAIAATTMAASVWMAARFGIVALVSKGYGLLAWLFIATFMIPLLTLGPVIMWRQGRAQTLMLERH